MRYRGNNYLFYGGEEDYREEEEKYCPVCGSTDPEEFYISLQTEECMGCSDCVNALEWREF